MLKIRFHLRSFIFRIFPDSASRHCTAELEPESKNQINTSYLKQQLKLHVVLYNWSWICWASSTPGVKQVHGRSWRCTYITNSHLGVRSLHSYCKQITCPSSCPSTLLNQHTRSIFRSKYLTFRSFLKELAVPQHLLIACVFGRLLRPWCGEQGRLQRLARRACQGRCHISFSKPPALRRSLCQSWFRASTGTPGGNPRKCSPCQREAREMVRRLKLGSWLSLS